MSKRLPKNLFAADHRRVEPSEAHLTLVFMLVVSQLAAGTSVAATFAPSTLFVLIAALAGFAAPCIGLLHLGKPRKAWRAFLGWRTSWFSREVIAFGFFGFLAASTLLSTFSGWTTLTSLLKAAAALAGLSGVACSAMVYIDTRREFWCASQSFGKFFETTLLLGSASAFAIQVSLHAQMAGLVMIATVVGAATIAKLWLEVSIFRNLSDEDAVLPTPLNKSARLLAGELRSILHLRIGCAILGGLVGPAIVALEIASGDTLWATVTGISWAALLLCVIGEFLERYLFFTAVAPERMPGGVAA